MSFMHGKFRKKYKTSINFHDVERDSKQLRLFEKTFLCRISKIRYSSVRIHDEQCIYKYCHGDRNRFNKPREYNYLRPKSNWSGRDGG